jgi:PAS domain S-box-containing protein
MASTLPAPDAAPPDRSQASYRTIFDASENAIFVLDWDSGAVIDVNQKACEAYGYTAAEMKTLSADDVSGGEPPYTREEARRYLALAREGRCPRFEWRRRNKDGGVHWDEVNVKPVELDGRRVLLVMARDVTDRKLAAEQLQAREEQYRRIFESSSDGMFLWDEEFRVVDVNPAGLSLYRLTREQAIGTRYDHNVSPEHAARRREWIARALGGQNVHVELPTVREDGTTFDAELRIMPSTHKDRPHALAVVRDIGERRQRERELQRSEARLRATVEAAFDAVVAIDAKGMVLEFNAAAERVFGYSRDAALGRRLSELILPQRHRAAHDRALAHFRIGGPAPMLGRLVETTARRADGSEFPVELAISVAEVPEGNIFVGHLRDISARRAAEAERNALEAQLRQAQKMEAVGQLTGGIAHDFNNILTSVVGYVVMAQERADTLGDGPLVRQLGQAHLAAQRARDLISQMLAFARRQKGDPRRLELTPLIRQTLRLLRSTLPSSISLDAQWLDADATGAPTCVMADPVQLEQILFNLCINARDAMAGVGRITVRLGTLASPGRLCASCRQPVPDGPWVDLQVADDGTGVAPEVLDRIFDPFFSTKAPGSGSGMGLAMVHGIVHDHQGHLLVDTALGQGTRFSVLLPAADGDAAPLQPPADSAPVRQPLPSGRLLVVEDDAQVGPYLQEQLAAWGLAVTLIASPAEALRWLAAEANAVDVVLTDLTMPGMNGSELAVAIQRLRPGLPVMLITGHGGELDEAGLRAGGVTCVLRKPVDTPQLRAELSAVLDARR